MSGLTEVSRAILLAMAERPITFADAESIAVRCPGVPPYSAYRVADRALQRLRKAGFAKAERTIGNSWDWSVTPDGHSALRSLTGAKP